MITAILIILTPQKVFAASVYDSVDVLELIDSLNTYEQEYSSTEFFPTGTVNTYNVSEPQDIVIPLVGMSSFLAFDKDTYDIAEEDYHDFLCNEVEYFSSDEEVVLVYDGRILANGVGTAIVTVQYQDMVQCFKVTVKNKLSEDEIAEIFNVTNVYSNASEDAQRDAIVEKARNMTYCEWYPTSNLIGWNGQHIFQAGHRQSGIPYSQATGGQCDEKEFLSAMNNSDFYTAYSEGGTAMPRYGNDCSAFVAICWGLPYNVNRMNTTSFYANYDSIGDYSNLKWGDAVVSTSDRHMFLIAQNWETPASGSSYPTSYVTCYEQTPYNAKLVIHLYSELQNKGYKPISMF